MKIIKMKWFIIIAFLWLTIFVKANSFVGLHGHISVKGSILVDCNCNPLMLRGVTLGWSHEDFNFYNHDCIEWLEKDWKVNVVRTAISMEQEGGYLDCPNKTLQLADSVITAAINSGIYVIVAIHCHNIHEKETEEFFKYISSKYGHFPNLIYEILSEPDDEPWAVLIPFYEKILNVIRFYDKTNVVIVSGSYWTQDLKSIKEKPIKNKGNVIYALHFCTGDSGKELRTLARSAIEDDLPLIVSDHVITDCSCMGKIFYDNWMQWIKWMESNYISWIVWSISDTKESCTLLKQGASYYGNWDMSDLKESGVLVRKTIKTASNYRNQIKDLK